MLTLNGKAIPFTLFPDQTSQVWKIQQDQLVPGKKAIVVWDFENEGEFLRLAQLKDLLDINLIPAILRISYLPYGRQDKPVSNNATFALSTFAKLLNSLNFKFVEIMDPHSSIAIDLIKNSVDSYPTHRLSHLLTDLKIDLVCYPDKGAAFKYPNHYSFPQPYFYGEKVRDQQTGLITNYKLILHQCGSLTDKKIMVVDDICDGGATFQILAKDLLANGAAEVFLFVTHGIFSKGLQGMKNSGIQRFFTQDGEASEENGQFIYRRL